MFAASDSEEFISLLKQHSIVPVITRNQSRPEVGVWYGEYGRGIVRHIIRPYLESMTGEEEQGDA